MKLIDETMTRASLKRRAVLMKFRKGEGYKSRILLLMPDRANALDKGNHCFAGGQVAERGRKKGWFPLPRSVSPMTNQPPANIPPARMSKNGAERNQLHLLNFA